MNNNQSNRQQNNNNKSKKDISVSLSDLNGSKFVDIYYRVIDYNRSLLSEFYRKSSVIQWNGKLIPSSTLKSFYAKIPSSRHSLLSLNVQPMSTLPFSPTPVVLITVNGKVSYLGSNAVPFTQTFVIQPQMQNSNANGDTSNSNGSSIDVENEGNDAYFIISDIFRLQKEVK